MRKLIAIGAACAITGSVLAQTVNTLPQNYDKKEGLRSRHIPFRYQPARIQNGFGPKATGFTATTVIRELWMRADRTAYLTTAFSCELRVQISCRGCNPKVPSMKFAANHGTDLKEFMSKTKYNIASFTAVGTGPAPFKYQLKGTAPFVCTDKSLVVDIQAYTPNNANQANVNFYVDATNLSGTPSGTRGSYTRYGTGCNPTNFWNYATGLNEGEAFRTYGYTRNVGDIVLCWLGVAQTNINLGGGCSLYTAPVIFHPVPVKTTATTGYANFAWGTLPDGTGGAKVWTQMIGIDGQGNFRFSRGNAITIGDYKVTYPFIAAHRYNYGSGTYMFDPDKDDARFGWERTAIIFERR